MKWEADISDPKTMHLEIRQDRVAGYYLFVWENGKGVRDDLQDTLEWAMAVAHEDCGVPKDSWRQME